MQKKNIQIWREQQIYIQNTHTKTHYKIMAINKKNEMKWKIKKKDYILMLRKREYTNEIYYYY